MAFPFYGADGTSGTVAVTNGSKNVTGTGTNWLSNNAVPTAGGYAIKMPDGQIYGIDACTGEGSLHLVENYNGSTVSGGAYYIMPVAAAIGKLLNDVSALLNSSSYSQLAGLSPSNGDYVQYVSGTWATRTALQSLLSLLNSMSEVNIASASTTDIGASTSPKVQITGTTTITGLGSQANAVRFVRFGGALTLTNNSSSLILPGSANITTESGDTAVFLSDASGNWRCWSYSRANGTPVVAGLSGSWTPTLTATTPPSGVTYNSHAGTYYTIGDLVFATGLIDVSSLGSGGSGVVQIAGLPYAPSSRAAGSWWGDNVGFGSGRTSIAIDAPIGTTSMSMITSGSGALDYKPSWADLSSGVFMSFSIVYQK